MLTRVNSSRVFAGQLCRRTLTQSSKVIEQQKRELDHLFERLSNKFVVETERAKLENPVLPRLGKLPSQEQQQFLASESEIDESEPFLRDLHPGDFVEIRRNLIVTHGIIIDIVLNTDAKLKFLTLTSTGDIWAHLPNDVHFVLPNFIEIRTVTACGNSIFAETQSQKQSRLQVVHRLRSFERDVEKTFNGQGRRITRLHPLLASTDPLLWNKVSLKQVLSAVDSTETPSSVHLFAMHKHLMLRTIYFMCGTSMQYRSNSFYVRPRRDVENLEKVREWVVTRSTELRLFIQKSKEIARIHRRTQKERERGECGLVVNKTAQFTSSDWEIILFLKQSVRQQRSTQTDPYDSCAKSIVNETRLYDEIINVETVHRFLQEIGIYAPWDDPVINNASSLLKQQTLEDSVALSETVPVIPSKLALRPIAELETKVHPDVPKLSSDFYSYDIVESQRHDFGDLPVFIIDDANAQELDDGVSAEPTLDGKVWIHVHVADPTLLLPPDHVISRQAEVNFSSLYLLQGNRNMLPKKFVELVQLGSKDKRREGHRTLTFSSLIDESGNMTDHKVQAGIIRNVHILSYNDVDASMGWGYNDFVFPFEESNKTTVFTSETPDKHKSKLTLLQDTVSRVIRRREREGIIQPTNFFSDVIARNSSFPKPLQNARESYIYSGTPDLQYRVSNSIPHNASRDMVAECMKLAGRAASLWFSERGIPCVRRTLAPFESTSTENVQIAKQLQKDQGFVDFKDLVRLGISIPSAINSLDNIGHSIVGAKDGEGYMRVTSPLRRYLDLVHHWQIKHIIAGGALSTIPFSQMTLADRIGSWTAKEHACDQTGSKQADYWVGKFISGCLQHSPDDFRATILHRLQGTTFRAARWDAIQRYYHTQVLIPTLGAEVQLSTSKDQIIKVGTPVEVKIESVVLDLVPIIKATLLSS